MSKIVFLLLISSLSFASEKYSIQVFSSSIKEETLKQVQNYNHIDHAFLYPIKIKDPKCKIKCRPKIFYRLFIGLYSSKKEAQIKLKEFQMQHRGFEKSLVQKVVK